MIKEISNFLNENTDEIIALIVVTPIISIMSYLAYTGVMSPELLLTPLGLVLGHYFTKKGN